MKKLIYILLFGCSMLYAQEKLWTLKDCIQYALENDLAIKEIALNTDFYQKETMGAYGNLLPDAGLYANHQYNFGSVIDPTTNARISSDIQSSSASFASNIELFNWGNFVRIKSAKLQKEKAAYDLEIKKNELIIRIVQTFNQVQYDKEQIELAQQHLANTQTHRKRIEREVELGNKAKSDLYEIQANETAALQTLVSAQNAYRESKLNLLNMLNLKQEVVFIPDEFLDLMPMADSLSSLYALGVEVRPEIKSAELQEKIKVQTVKEMKSNYLPTIRGNYSLSSFYVNTNPIAFQDQFKNNQNHFLGFSLNFPLFNKLQTRTAVQQAKIELEQATLQSEQQKQAYYQALSEAYAKTKSAYESRLAAENNAEAQKKSFLKTEEKFRQGVVDAYAYFSAKNNLLSAQTTLLQAKYTYRYERLLLDWYVTNTVGF